jgi:outer membrane scaffolding protein for murein synthesis (MipA/OmpV family)
MRSIALTGLMALAPLAETAAQEPGSPRNWNLTLGAGVLTVPRYPGSDEYRVLPYPLLQGDVGNRVYLGPATTGIGYGLGAYAIRTERVGLAFELGGQWEREASDADALAGMEDRDPVGTLGASLGYRFGGSFEALVAVSQGLNDGAGTIGTVRLQHARMVGKSMLSLGVGAAFASAEQMRREFGITDAEATRRQAMIDAGDDRLEPDDGRPYAPEAGLRHLGAGLSLVHPVGGKWSMIGFGGMEWLGDEAATSPLVRERVQLAGGVGMAYRF